MERLGGPSVIVNDSRMSCPSPSHRGRRKGRRFRGDNSEDEGPVVVVKGVPPLIDTSCDLSPTTEWKRLTFTTVLVG